MKSVYAVGRSAAACAFAFAAVAVCGQAVAATATGSFTVGITIQAECTVQSTANVAFGTAGVLTANLDAAGALGIQCTDGTPYTVALDDGTGVGATTGQRKMTSAGGDVVDYSLYRDSTRQNVWGSATGSNTEAGTGNGAVQNLPVYGRVGPQTTPPPGNYSDTIQVTITY